MNGLVKCGSAFLLSMLALLVAAGCSRGGEAPPLEGAAIGGPFTLVSQDGDKVSNRDFDGRYRLIYFGYSYCPDVCPVDLLALGQGLSQFEKTDAARAAQVQPIFISIDPERDTPELLKDYVAAFHPRLVGLTGSPEQIADVARRYGIAYSKRGEDGASDYLVDHSRQAILFGPQGEPIALVPQDEGAAAVAAALDRWVE